MHPSIRLSAARVHKPLIRFIGKRTWPTILAPHPHPAAPPEYRKTFSGIVQQTSGATPVAQQTSVSAQTEHPLFLNFWDAPPRYWRPKHRELEEFEIELIQSGGASLH